jgi:hypothetical protein
MATPGNLVEAANSYLARGYTHDFRADGRGVWDVATERVIALADLQVDAALRFEDEPGAPDASNFYAITDRATGARGLLIDAFDVLRREADAPVTLHLDRDRQPVASDAAGVPTRYGLRVVSKHDFHDDPQRYVLRVGFPDFPACPFGERFSMLGFDTSEQTYVWLATGVMRNTRLLVVPYQDAEVPDND